MSDDRNRPRIRNAADANKQYDGSNLQFAYNRERLEKENRYRVKGQAFPKTINCFNWGACILPPIWGLFNKTPIACLGLVLAFIPYMGILISMIFSVYCGVKGNEWAWENNDWKDINEFHAVQRKWAVWAISIEAAFILVAGIISLTVVQFFKNGY